MLTRLKYQFRKLQAKYYSKKLIYSFDEDWFKDKRVAIVGGADSVLKERKGDYIDGFDVVVRINKGIDVIDQQKEFVGTKTDFLFHAFFDNINDIGRSPITIDLWKKHNVKNLIYSSNHTCSKKAMYNFLNFVRKTNAKYRCTELTPELYHKNNEAIAPFWPTTGFIAINTVVNCNPKELYITGITFFKTPHNTAYRSESIEDFQKMFQGNAGNHNPDAEYRYLKSLYSTPGSFLSVDKTLEKIIATN